MKILSFDPGKRNTWWTLYRTTSRGIKLIESAHFDLNPDADIDTRLHDILRDAYRLLKRIKPDYVVAERFVQRRRGKGNTAEHVNHFLGILYVLCYKFKILTIYTTSSVHKSWIKRNFDGKEPQEIWTHLNDHQADASSLALWAWNRKIKKK